MRDWVCCRGGYGACIRWLPARQVLAHEIKPIAYSSFWPHNTYYAQTLDTLTTFVFAIVNHPEVQERARAELHAVVGSDRLPEMEDRKNLPYVERVVQETFRRVALMTLHCI